MKQTAYLAGAGLGLVVVSGFVLVRLGSSENPWMRPGPEARPIGTTGGSNSFTIKGVSPVGSDGSCRLYYSDSYSGGMEQMAEGSGPPGGLGVWFEVDLPPDYNANPDGTAHSRNYFTVTATPPGGENVSLAWQIKQAPNRHLLLAMIPAGYPDSTHSVEISIRNRFLGKSDRWQIDRLPPTRRAFPSQPAKLDSVSAGGFTVRGRAFRNSRGDLWFNVRVLAANQVVVGAWELSLPTDVSTEWEPAGEGSSVKASLEPSWIRPGDSSNLASIGEQPGSAAILPSEKELSDRLASGAPQGAVTYTRVNDDRSYTFGTWPAPFSRAGSYVRFTIWLRETDPSQNSTEKRRIPATFTVPIEDWKSEWAAVPKK